MMVSVAWGVASLALLPCLCFFECALNRVFLPVVAFFCFLSGGMAFWLLFRLVCGFKRFGACLVFYLGSLLFAVWLLPASLFLRLPGFVMAW